MEPELKYVSREESTTLLCNAIIARAADDYIQMQCGIHIPGIDQEEPLRFFRSDYYRLLTDMDGEKLIGMLNDEIKACGRNYKTFLARKVSRASDIYGPYYAEKRTKYGKHAVTGIR